VKDLNALPRNSGLAVALPARDSQFPLSLHVDTFVPTLPLFELFVPSTGAAARSLP